MTSAAYRTIAALALLCIGALRMPAPTLAASVSSYDACMKDASTTIAMQTCQSAEVDRLDARIARAMASALAALPADQQVKLRASQRLWTAFRSKDCDVFYGSQTGTIATIQGGGCMIDHANERLKDLAAFLPDDH